MKYAKAQSKEGKRGVSASYYPDAIKKEEVFKKFIEFSSMPDPDKCEMLEIPFNEKTGKYQTSPSQVAFAKKFGVAEKTLSAWKGHDTFHKSVEQKQRSWGSEKLPNVLAALYRRCIKYGFASDVELYLAYYAGWDRKQLDKYDGRKYELGDLRSLIAKLPLEKQQQFYGTLADIIRESEVSGGDRTSEDDSAPGRETDTIIVQPETNQPTQVIGAEHSLSEKA